MPNQHRNIDNLLIGYECGLWLLFFGSGCLLIGGNCMDKEHSGPKGPSCSLSIQFPLINEEALLETNS